MGSIVGMNTEVDGLGRPVLGEEAAQCAAFNRLLWAALNSEEPDGGERPLGAAAEMAHASDEKYKLVRLMRVMYTKERLVVRDLVSRGIDPGYTEEEIWEDCFGKRV
jgi:hypothetical protein